MAFFLIFAKNPILSWFINNKQTNRSLIIIDLCLFYRFVVRFSKNCHSIQYLNFLMIIILPVTNQSGFRPSDSCEYQLLSIVHDIYASFDCCPSLEVRGVFLDISKAFDRVWHEGLIYKLQSLGISGLPLKCIESFLSNISQSLIKWSVIFMVSSASWRASRICLRASIIFSIY